MDMTNVEPLTTRRQVRRAFNGQEATVGRSRTTRAPSSSVPDEASSGATPIRPGKYLELCFWPSAEDGMTHAEMGMWNFITLL